MANQHFNFYVMSKPYSNPFQQFTGRSALSLLIAFVLLFVTQTLSAQNLALNKTVTSSSIIAATPASNLTDGDTTTAAGTSNTTVAPNGEWFQIDLGADKIIETIKITARAGQHDRGRRFMIITWPSVLGASSLGANPTTYIAATPAVAEYNRLVYTRQLTSGSVNVAVAAPGSNLGPDYSSITFNVGIHEARYIRIISLQDTYFDLAELQVFEASLSPQRNFINGGFENGPTFTTGIDNIHEGDIIGWSTTEAIAMYGSIEPQSNPAMGSFLEIWRSGFLGVPANEGNYFTELNAFTNGSLSQTPICVLAGETFTWSFAHRGREGTDVMALRINDVDVASFADSNAAGGTHTGTVLSPATTTITSTVPEAGGWTQYTGTWTNTTGAAQSVIFAFRAISSARNSISVGNFLDDVRIIPLSPLVTFTAPTVTGTELSDLPKLLVVGTVPPAGATVQINITGGTATRGVDYTTTPATGNITITIPAGQYDGSEASAVSLAPYIRPVQDKAPEGPSESINMLLQNAVRAVIPGGTSCDLGSNALNYVMNDIPPATLSGNLFADGNGLSNSLIDGAPYSGPQLYVNIIDQGGVVVAAAPVSPADGTYSIPNIIYGTYTIQINTVQGITGNIAPAQVFPSGKIPAGDGAGAGDGTPNGLFSLTVNAGTATVDFGLNSVPVANPDNSTNNTPGQPVVIDPLSNDTDPEGNNTIDPTRVSLVPPPGALGMLTDPSGDITGFTIPGQGTWSTDQNTGMITFTPLPAFTGNPTPVEYTVKDLAGATTSPSAVSVTYGTTLPVELIRFSATLSGNDVMVNWSTAQEMNSSRFEIECSLDGIAYNKVGETTASNNSSTVINYSYRHVNAILNNAAMLFYRLRMVDLDGTSNTSRVVMVNLKTPSSTAQLFPNPVVIGGMVTVRMANIQQVSLYDMNGKRVFTRKYKNQSLVSLPVSGISAGTYILLINNKQVGSIIVK